MPPLVARGVSKSVGPVAALVDVDFDVDAGEMWIDGRHVPVNSPADATRASIATVYQDLALCDNLDVVGNLYLGAEETEPGLEHLLGVLDEAAMEVRTRELLTSLAVATLESPRSRVEPTAALGVIQTAQVLALIPDRRTAAREDVVAAITGGVAPAELPVESVGGVIPCG